MRTITTHLREQHHELAGLLDGLAPPEWYAATRCEGWDVLDVVIHLTQTDELALASVDDQFDEVLHRLAEDVEAASSIDAGAAELVAMDRARTPDPAMAAERWRSSASVLADALDAADPHHRVQWVAGTLSMRTLATTRLAETWIHTGDVAEALGVTLAPTDRLRPIARLAWRTLPYAFASAGRTLTGPVAFHLTGPAGDAWDFVPDEPPATTVRGPAADLCDVAARRRDPAATDLRTDGPDGAAVLALVRTYA